MKLVPEQRVRITWERLPWEPKTASPQKSLVTNERRQCAQYIVLPVGWIWERLSVRDESKASQFNQLERHLSIRVN